MPDFEGRERAYRILKRIIDREARRLSKTANGKGYDGVDELVAYCAIADCMADWLKEKNETLEFAQMAVNRFMGIFEQAWKTKPA